MNKKIISIKNVGAVLFQKSKRARLVRIVIKSSNEIKVVLPDNVSYKKAQDLFMTKLSWVKRTIQKINKNLQERNMMEQVTLSKEEIEKGISFLTKRIEFFAQKYQFNYNKLSFRNQKTIWGSCSSKNNISLNIKILKLPAYLQDYVILHELMHTKFKNHQKEYWNEFKKILKNAKKYDKELNNLSLRIL